jgi:hypothetical protein
METKPYDLIHQTAKPYPYRYFEPGFLRSYSGVSSYLRDPRAIRTGYQPGSYSGHRKGHLWNIAREKLMQREYSTIGHPATNYKPVPITTKIYAEDLWNRTSDSSQ